MVSPDPSQSPATGVAVEFERLSHRSPSEAERLVIDEALRGGSAWVEGLRPESLATLAVATAQALGVRVLFVSPDAELLSQRQHRYGARASVHLLGPTQSQRPPTGSVTLLCPVTQLTSSASSQSLGPAPNIVFVEQGHAITPASTEYRPSLSRVRELAEKLGVPLIVGAAHGTPEVAQEAREAFGLAQARVVVEPLGPVSLQVVGARARNGLAALVARLPRPALVLCATPAEADAIYGELCHEQLPCHRFHSALPARDRAIELLQFALPGRRAILVATSSFAPQSGLAGEGDSSLPEDFGRGYGRADLRSIVHVNVPGSLEQLSQEFGLLDRSGSSEDPGYAVILADAEYLDIQASVLERKRPHGDTLLAVVQRLKAVARGAWIGESQVIEAVGGSERAARLAIAFLKDEGALETQSEGGRAQVRASSLSRLERAVSDLAAAFERLRSGDAERRERTLAFLGSTTCRVAALETAWGRRHTEACGLCDVCAPERQVETASFAESMKLRERRPPVTKREAQGFDDDDSFVDDGEAFALEA